MEKEERGREREREEKERAGDRGNRKGSRRCIKNHLYTFTQYNCREVISWAESQHRRRDTSPELDDPQPEKNQLTQADMAMVKFEQLRIRQGYPYLYNHHGNCEHLLVFTDIR